jgi:sugar phosphate isomerase/epimerase
MPESGLIHYNFRGSLEEFLDFAQATGFQCTELQVNDVWKSKEGESFAQAQENASRVREMLAGRGLRASALQAGNDFLLPDEQAMAAQVERMEKVCALARILDTSVLRIDGGWPKPDLSSDRFLDLVVDGLTRSRPFIEAEGFFLALDNHGLVTNDADFQIEVFRRVGSKNVGANIDTMNYRWAGHDIDTVKRFYKQIAPYVLHTHFKDGTGSRGSYIGLALGEGEIPLTYAVECLKEAGYEGPWVVEYEGKTDSREGYRKGLEWLREHV